jgi:hypothetical protein
MTVVPLRVYFTVLQLWQQSARVKQNKANIFCAKLSMRTVLSAILTARRIRKKYDEFVYCFA